MIGRFHYTLVLIKQHCIFELGLLVVRTEINIKSKEKGTRKAIKNF